MTMPVSRRRSAAVLLVWIALLAVCAAVIARTPFSADLSAFLPADPDARQRVLIEQLQSGSAARLLLIGIEGGSAAERAQASRRLAASLRAGAAFDQVLNGDNTIWQAAGTWLFDHRYQLSPAVTAARFSVEGLREAIADTVSLLGTPAGTAVKPLLERDPTGETTVLAESLLPATAPRSEEGVWVSRDAPRAILLATTHAAGADLDAQAAAIDRVHQAFAPLSSSSPDRLTLVVSGAPVFAVDSRATIEAEVRHLSIVGTLMVGGFLLLAFASLRSLAAGLLPVATGVIAGITAVSLAFGTVHGMTLGFGATLIGETVDYAIYYLIQARGRSMPSASREAAAQPGWQRWLKDSWPTVRLGLLTSVCGFAALVFSGFPGLSQLGVFSIAGLVGAALATRFVMPVLMPDGAPGIGLRRQMARGAGACVRVLPRLKGVFIGLGAAALTTVLWRGAALWQGDLASLSPVPAAAQALDAALRKDLGASDARTLVVARGADAQAALRAAERAGQRLDRLVEQGLIAGYESPARLLPSIDTQRARLAALPDAATLQQRLAAATAGGPLGAERLAPFVDQIRLARQAQPFGPEGLRGTGLEPALDAMLVHGAHGGWTALIALQPMPGGESGESGDRSDRGIAADAVRAALDEPPSADIQVIDIKHELDSLYAGYLGEAFWQAGLGALGVVLLLGVHLRSARRLLAVCQPLALAVLLTLGGLAAMGVSLGILHLVGLLLVVAVGSNYALFFDQLRQQARLDDDTLASLLLANLTTVASFGLIALSGIPALSAIGRVVAPGALLALLLAASFARVAAKART